MRRNWPQIRYHSSCVEVSQVELVLHGAIMHTHATNWQKDTKWMCVYVMHLSMYCPTTPPPSGDSGQWWGFGSRISNAPKCIKSPCKPHASPRSTMGIWHRKNILCNFQIPHSWATLCLSNTPWWAKVSCQIPYYSPTETRGGWANILIGS